MTKVEKSTNLRLNKYIALTGFCSRRKADDFVKNGKVCVNGQIIKSPWYEVLKGDEVKIDGQIVNQKHYTYIRYYKPCGYITTKSDEKGRKTIYDLLPPQIHHLKPAGRLDKDSTGLIILTNDGELINQLTHPSLKVAKTYKVVVQGWLVKNDLEKLQQGINLDGKMAFAYVNSAIKSGSSKEKTTTLELVLFQGLNRQIRKMMDKINHPCLSLKRISHATISLEGLKRGQFKYINNKQIIELNNYIKKLKE